MRNDLWNKCYLKTNVFLELQRVNVTNCVLVCHKSFLTAGNQLLTPMEQWQPRYPGGVSPQGIRPQAGVPQAMQPGTQMGQPSPMQAAAVAANQAAAAAAGGIRPPGGAGAPMNTPANIMQKQALAQLMHTLRSPHSAEQQDRILSILKANPQLMAAFIKQRQVRIRYF